MAGSLWRRAAGLLTVIILSLVCLLQAAGAADTVRADRVVIVLIDKLTVDDFADNSLPEIKSLATAGSVGLLNNNTGAGIYSEHTYSTIGGGAHLIGVGDANNAFNASEKVADATAASEFFRRTGWQASPHAVVQLAVGKLMRANNTLPYPAVPGALGQALHTAGLKTAVLGNADTPGVYRRLATTITMDSQGLTDMGCVDETILLPHSTGLGYYRTNFSEILKKFNEYRNKGASLIVIETGDSSRLYEEKDKATDFAYQRQRAEALAGIDRFVGKLARQMDFTREVLLVITPTPTAEAIKENKNLTPIIAIGPGLPAGSLLTSGTTKRDGIVMNTDIAPTVLKYLGLLPAVGMSGRPLLTSGLQLQENGFDYLIKLNQQLVTTYQARPPLQSAYVLVQLFVLFTALYGIFFKRHMAELIKPFLLVVMAVPLAELLMPLLPRQSVAMMALMLILTTLLIAASAILVNKKTGLDPFIFICITSATAILADLLNGSYLQKQSLLGYDPIVGARFYGIGNEYMGVLIGSVIIGTTAAIQYWSNWRRPLIAAGGLLFLVTIYAMAAPNIGTNVGGTIAASSALLVTFLLLIGVRFRLRTLMLVGLLVVLAVSGFIAFDLTRPPDLRSHMGTTASLILQSGPAQAIDIIQRKWAMNMKLLRYTVWSRVLLASLGVLALLFYRPRGVMENIRVKYPYLFKGFVGVVTGAIVAFLVNDSGVVAAATTMIFGAPPLVYLVLTEQTADHRHTIK
ncbi:membrane protein [Desulfotomaculum varum]